MPSTVTEQGLAPVTAKFNSHQPPMGHDVAKLLLEQASTPAKRVEAVHAAMELGMPLNEIEAFLDYLEQTQQSPSRNVRKDNSISPQ